MTGPRRAALWAAGAALAVEAALAAAAGPAASDAAVTSDAAGAAASAAGAGSGSGHKAPSSPADALGARFALPAGWIDQPALTRAPAKVAAPVKVEARRGVADPADGCFALIERVSAPAGRAALGQVVAGFRQALEHAGFTTHSATGGFAWAGHGVEGRARVLSVSQPGDRIAALSAACFYNHREPDRCRVTCNTLLESLSAAP